jgi:hypothetical protein
MGVLVYEAMDAGDHAGAHAAFNEARDKVVGFEKKIEAKQNLLEGLAAGTIDADNINENDLEGGGGERDSVVLPPKTEAPKKDMDGQVKGAESALSVADGKGSVEDYKNAAKFANDNKEDIKKAAEFYGENKEACDKAAKVAYQNKDSLVKGAKFAAKFA